MERHISIFAFLLCAFATVGLTGTARGTERIVGEFVSLAGTWKTDDKEKISPAYASLEQNGSQVFEAISPSGYKVTKWLWCDDYSSMARKGETDMEVITGSGEKRWVSSDLKTCTVKYSGDGSRALGVRFDYITYNVQYDANGGSPTPQAASGKVYNKNFNLAEEAPTKTGYTFSKWKAETNGSLFDAGASVSGADLCPDDWHKDGETVMLRAQWEAKPYAVTYKAENCTLTSQPASGTYDQPLSIAWIKDADVGEMSTVTVYDGKDGTTQIKSVETTGTTFDFKMSDLGKGYYESVVIKVACTKNVRHDLTLKKGDGVKAITWKTNDCAWVRSETDVNLPGLLAGTTWAAKVVEADVERGYEGPNETSGTMYADKTQELKGTPHHYTVDYDLQGGEKKSGGNYPVNENFGDSFYVSAPTKTDRTFLGWIVITNKDDLTCAKWGTSADDITHEVLPDTPCANGATGDVFFKNLTSIKGEKIWLKAKWSGLTRTITAVAEPDVAGTVSGGGEIDDGTKATLEATPNDGYSFCCWTNGNEVVSTDNPWTFTVTADASFAAVFTGNVYRVTFDIGDYDGDTPRAIFVRFGSPYGTLPEPVYEEELRKFVCWRDEENGNVISAETIVQTPKKHTLVADSTLKQTYTIVYDGNGETSGMMEGQIAIRDEGTVLKSNGFNRTGYDFAGWTNTVVEAFYADGATVTNLAAANQTATLYAVWTPHTYTVKFDKNFDDPTYPDMNDQSFAYDEVKPLSPNQYLYPDAKYAFIGWAESQSGNVVYADKEVVSNLTTVANGTVTLYAKWGFTNELSVAADCDRERADGRQPVELTTSDDVACKSVEAEGDPGGNGLTVELKPVTGGKLPSVEMYAFLTGPGVLKFHYKTSISNWGSELEVKLSMGRELLCKTTVSEWTEHVIRVPDSDTYPVTWNFAVETKDADFALIDNIRWIPDGAGPSYAADDTPVTGFSMAEGQLGFSFAADGSSTYHILGTNDVAAPWPWPFVREIKADETQPVRIGIKADEPKMFYRIRALIP